MTKTNKIVILCGGTGGHFYPGLTIARKFVKNGGQVELFLTGKHSGKQAELAETYDISSTLLPTQPTNIEIPGKILFILALAKVTLKAVKALKNEKPDAILGMGSFTSFPTALAAKLMWIPIYLHDGNARIGKANLFLSKWAKKTMLAFPAVNTECLKSDSVITGMPLRPELHADTFRQKTKKSLIGEFNDKFNAKFKIRAKVILIFGGSQGASIFNDIFPKAALATENKKFQVIHIAGKGNDAEVQIKYKNAEFANKIIENTEEMSLLYSLADIVFCRAGGSTIAELALFAKFAVLVPYPYAADNHQSDNADYYTSTGAGIKIDNKDCSPEKFSEIITDFLENPAKFAKSGTKATILAKPEAAETVLKYLSPGLEK